MHWTGAVAIAVVAVAVLLVMRVTRRRLRARRAMYAEIGARCRVLRASALSSPDEGGRATTGARPPAPVVVPHRLRVVSHGGPRHRAA
jgi:hypothetical protein